MKNKLVKLLSTCYVLETDKASCEILKILYENTDLEENNTEKMFTGSINREKLRFSIHKTFRGQNSFIAILEGEVISLSRYSRITIYSHPPWVSAIFFLGWSYFFAMNPFLKFGSYFGCLIASVMGICFWGFYYHSHLDSRKKLLEIFDGKGIEQGREEKGRFDRD